MPTRNELICRRREQSDAEFLLFNFPGDADNHGVLGKISDQPETSYWATGSHASEGPGIRNVLHRRTVQKSKLEIEAERRFTHGHSTWNEGRIPRIVASCSVGFSSEKSPTWTVGIGSLSGDWNPAHERSRWISHTGFAEHAKSCSFKDATPNNRSQSRLSVGCGM